jgi:acyl-CoA dehydrogenase
MYFSQAAVDVRGLPKLEGTVHVNIALIVKFMPSFFFAPAEFAPVATQSAPRNDDFLFRQGGTKGLGQIQFHDYRKAFDGVDLPNVKLFAEQAEVFRELLASDPPGPDQMKDVAFLLAGGEIFALVVYAQLILENVPVYGIGDDLLDQIFDFMVRDMSKFALQLYSQPSSTPRQMEHCQRMVRKPVHDAGRYGRVWEREVAPLSAAYEMRP